MTTFIKPGMVEPREYQLSIADSIIKNGNTLVVLPTGLGKTIVAMLVIDHFLKGDGKIMFLAPTKPLAEQHFSKLMSSMEIRSGEIVLLTGKTSSKKRKELWDSKIIVATPQTIQNDLANEVGNLKDFKLVIFDEVHRGVGKYAYTYVAGECVSRHLLIVGLTASPGGSKKKIDEVTGTLNIRNIEIRTEDDADVRKYMKELNTTWVEVQLPQGIIELRSRLEEVINENFESFKRLGYVRGSYRTIPKGMLLALRDHIINDPSPRRFRGLTLYALLFKLIHAHELLETQGVSTFLEFFRRLESKEPKSRAIKQLFNDQRIVAILEDAKKLDEEHPKLQKLCEILKNRQGTFIVFVQYRDQISKIVEELNKMSGIRAARFVGKRDGVSQKDQEETIAKFRSGDFNVLVASSIGEEGLDIPSVDYVIFYEPIPNEIRNIQRRGRAGRAKAGEVIILITKGTKDETYHWIGRKKEKKMYDIVNRMKRNLQKPPEPIKPVRQGQTKLLDFGDSNG